MNYFNVAHHAYILCGWPVCRIWHKGHHLILERETFQNEQGQGNVDDIKWSTIVLVVIQTKPLSFFFFQNNNENNWVQKQRNSETTPKILCTEDLFRQTQEHRLEQTHLNDDLMPDEIMNPRYKFLSKLMREVLVFLDSYKDPSFDFLHLFSTSIPVFNMFLHLLEIWHLLNRTWFKLMFWADFVPVTTGDPTAATSPETKWIIKYRIKQKSA